MTDIDTAEQLQGPPAEEPDDSFEILARVGDTTRTLGYAGRARVDGHPFTWTAEVHDSGMSLDPKPVAPATWDSEKWTLEDGTVVDPEKLMTLMSGLGRTLQAVTNGAADAAARAYTETLDNAFGEIALQRAIFL